MVLKIYIYILSLSLIKMAPNHLKDDHGSLVESLPLGGLREGEREGEMESTELN